MELIKTVSYLLLALGLYASVYGIEHEHLRNQAKKIASLLSIGIILKTVIMTVGLYFLLGVELGYAWLFSLALAQIDPIGTAKYLEGSNTSARVKSILRTVSSFDDPITVILTVVGIGFIGIENNSFFSQYLVSLLYNIGFAIVLIQLFRYLESKKVWVIHVISVLVILIVVWKQLFLGLAVAALFVRPKHYEQYLPRVVKYAFYLSLVILIPFIRLDTSSIVIGLVLGMLSYSSQILVGLIMTRGMKQSERRSIMFAQFNGITSVILALFLNSELGNDLYNIPLIIISAILVVDGLYYLFNRD